MRAKAARVARGVRDATATLRVAWAWTHEARTWPSLHYRYSYDIGNVLAVRMFGFYADDGVVRWRKWPAILSVAFAFSPILLAAWIQVREDVPTHLLGEYVVWLAYFFGFSVTSWMFTFGGVKLFHALTPELESMLTARGRVAYDRWADAWTSLPRQVLFCAFFSLAAEGAFAIAENSPGVYSGLYVSAASHSAVLVTAFFVAGGAYWILGGVVASWLLTRPGRLDLLPFAPVSTPGVELLARIYTIAFFAASFAVMICLIPVLSLAYRSEGNSAISFVKGGYFVLSIAAALAIALLPHLFLSVAVARERRTHIHRVHQLMKAELSAKVAVANRDADFHAVWLQTLVGSRRTTLSESLTVGVVLGLLAAGAPYVWHYVR